MKAAVMALRMREAASLIEEWGERYPDIPVPAVYCFRSDLRLTLAWFLDCDPFYCENQRAAARRITSCLGGRWTEQQTGDWISLTQDCDGVELSIRARVSAVMERVVVGTTKVHQPTLPEIPGGVEEYPIVEWRGAPLLNHLEVVR